MKNSIEDCGESGSNEPLINSEGTIVLFAKGKPLSAICSGATIVIEALTGKPWLVKPIPIVVISSVLLICKFSSRS